MCRSLAALRLGPMREVLAIYLVGVLVGLWRVDARGVARVALALVWPVGLLAAAVTTPVLIAVAAIRFPLFGVAVAGVVAMAVWWWAG